MGKDARLVASALTSARSFHAMPRQIRGGLGSGTRAADSPSSRHKCTCSVEARGVRGAGTAVRVQEGR